MKRIILSAVGVLAVCIWGLRGRGALGWWRGDYVEWRVMPNGTTWPIGAWGLPLVVLFLFGGAALLSVYDRFRRAKTRKEEKNSVATALICLGVLGFLWPWTLLGPGNLSRVNERSDLARVTLEGRLNLLASQWSDVATEYFGAAYGITDGRAFAHTYADARQHPASPSLAHIATHPPGATLLFYGARRVVEGVPGLNGALNSLAATLTAQDEATLYKQLSLVRETSSLGAGVPAPPPLSRGAIGGALFCVLLMGLSLVLALPAVYGLATTGIADDNEREARGLFACALWVLAPTLNLYAFSLDAVVAGGAAWTLFFAARALATGRRRFAVGAGGALALTTMLSFGALALGIVIVLAAVFGHTPRAPAVRVAFWVALAFGGTWLAAALWGGFNPLVVMSQATAAHHFATLRVRSYAPWVGMNLVMWAVFCGWPLGVAVVQAALGGKELIMRSGSRNEAKSFPMGTAFALATVSALVLLSLSGQVRGEVERLWLFFLAPLAACALVRSRKEAGVLAALQAVQTLVMAATIAPLVRPF